VKKAIWVLLTLTVLYFGGHILVAFIRSATWHNLMVAIDTIHVSYLWVVFICFTLGVLTALFMVGVSGANRQSYQNQLVHTCDFLINKVVFVDFMDENYRESLDLMTSAVHGIYPEIYERSDHV
jgi:hypothetical protein